MDAWDLPAPHRHRVVARPADMDGYGHVNNAVYVRWLDEAAWSHSAALGLPAERCLASGRGMAVWRTQVNYLAPAFAGDDIEVGTWILYNDGRLRVDRRFQLLRVSDGRSLVRALVHYVCIDLASGRPRRMPPEYASAYRPLEEVRTALAEDATPFLPGVEPPR
jgi:acyl-CoA thioester hydrolase